MKNFLKHFFIPHEHNDYKPHILREFSIIILLFFTLLIFATTLSIPTFIDKYNLAAIYSSVLVELTNTHRGDLALNTLKVNPLLEAAAKAKAEDMAKNEYFAHNSPYGLTPWYWIRNSGYDYLYAGENLAVNFTDSEDVEEAWMNSPGHRANILNNNFTEIGIGMANGMYQGREVTFVVQMFGSPKKPIVIDSSLPVTSADTLPFTTSEKVSIVPITKVASAFITNEVPEKEIKEEFAVAAELAAVKSAEASDEVAEVPVEMGTIKGKENVSHWYDKFFTNPTYIAKNIYAGLAILITFILSLYSLVEWRTKHYKNIIYGLLFLIIVLSTLSFHYYYFTPNVVVG